MAEDNKYPIQATYKFNGEEKPLGIRKRIPYHEVGALVKTVADSVYNDGSEMYYAVGLLTDIAIVEAFTDLEFPSDLEELYEIVEDSNLMEVIYANTSSIQCYRINKGVEDAISDLKNVSEFDLFMGDLREMIAKFDNNIEDFIDPDKINALLDMAAKKDKIIAEAALNNVDKEV